MPIIEKTTDELEPGDMIRRVGQGIEFTCLMRVRWISNTRRRIETEAGVAGGWNDDCWEVEVP